VGTTGGAERRVRKEGEGDIGMNVTKVLYMHAFFIHETF
jgi:hypothetical protein